MFHPPGVPIQLLDPGTHNHTEYRDLLLLPEEHGSKHLRYDLYVDLGDVLTGDYDTLRRRVDRAEELMEDAAMWYSTREHSPNKEREFRQRMRTLERLTYTLELIIGDLYCEKQHLNTMPPPAIVGKCSACKRRYKVRPGESRDYHDCTERVDQVSGNEAITQPLTIVNTCNTCGLYHVIRAKGSGSCRNCEPSL